LVLWESSDSSATPPYTAYGTRVDASTGAVLDPSGILLPTSDLPASATCVGNDWLIAAGDFRGMRLSSSGGLLDQTPFFIAAAGPNTQNDSLPIVSCASTSCLVTWADSRGSGISIYASRLDAATGTLLDASDVPIDLSGVDQDPWVACFGT